jgi:hypothetical protein
MHLVAKIVGRVLTLLAVVGFILASVSTPLMSALFVLPLRAHAHISCAQTRPGLPCGQISGQHQATDRRMGCEWTFKLVPALQTQALVEGMRRSGWSSGLPSYSIWIQSQSRQLPGQDGKWPPAHHFALHIRHDLAAFDGCPGFDRSRPSYHWENEENPNSRG